MSKLDHYQTAAEAPQQNIVWNLYGAGLENLGVEHRPEAQLISELSPDELLVRVDAVGLCASDFKIMNLGEKHPSMVGRDLKSHPVILGHEASVTVIMAGKNREELYYPGQKFCILPGSYYHGVCVSIGYSLDGALQQYMTLGKEILDGDEGVYLAPLKKEQGYSEAAMVEPWSCVEGAYHIHLRSEVKADGILWVVGFENRSRLQYKISQGFTKQQHPRQVLITDLPSAFQETLMQLCADCGVPLQEVTCEQMLEQVGQFAVAGLDDIVCLGTPDKKFVNTFSQREYWADGGCFAILSNEPMTEKVDFNARRVHYDNAFFIGADSDDIADAYRTGRDPLDFLPNGSAVIVGAGGPMGRMHIQRAVYKKNGPHLIVACDPDQARAADLKERYSGYMQRIGRRLEVLDTSLYSDENSLREKLICLNHGQLYDDLILCAPVGDLVQKYQPIIGKNGVMNVFAGIMKDFVQKLDISCIYLQNQRWIGSCGTKYHDFFHLVELIENGELDTDSSIAAIGGMETVWQALKALTEGAFCGKTVIYPFLKGLNLMTLEQVAEKYPHVKKRMKEGRYWCREAEQALFEELLP